MPESARQAPGAKKGTRVPENAPGFDSRTFRLTPDVRLRLMAQGVSLLSLAVLDALADHDWADKQGLRKGVVWPKTATLAHLCRVTERTVRTHLGHLIRAGLISRVGDGGRGRPAVVTLHWSAICGNPDPRRTPQPAETRIQRARAQKPSKTKNQQKPAAPAGSASAPPPRRVREAVPDGVPCPPEVAAQLAALFDTIGGRRVARTAAPARVFDRQEREAWADAQLARAREMGLG